GNGTKRIRLVNEEQISTMMDSGETPMAHNSIFARMDNRFDIRLPGDSSKQRHVLKFNLNMVQGGDSSINVAMKLLKSIRTHLDSNTISDADSVASQKIIDITTKAFGTTIDSFNHMIKDGGGIDFSISKQHDMRLKNTPD